MSLTDNNDNLSIAPLLVLITVPDAAGASGRAPLGPLVAGRPHPERVVEDGQRPPVDDGRAAGYHDHRR